MTTAETIPQPELPTIYRPKAIRSGLTAALTYSENDGRALQVIFEGLDDAMRPIRLSVPPGTVVALAAFCAARLPESERV